MIALQIDHRHVLHLHGAYDGRQTRFLPADQCLRCATGNSYAVHHLMRRLQHIRQHRSMANFKMDRFILNSCFVVYISHYCWIWPIGQASFLGRIFCFQGKMPLRSLQKLPAAASHIRPPLGKAMCAIPNQRKSANQT